MLDITHFEEVFAPDTHRGDIYPHSTVNAIRANRRTLGGALFFDKLLSQLQVKSGYLYPPSKNADLHELHERIITAPIADHYKQTLLFYLLKDCSGDGDTLAEDFAKAVCLPRKYWVVIEGLWHLDRLQFTNALESLTHPSLLPTFPEDVLKALLEHATDQGLYLPLAYYNTVRPPLTDPELQKTYFRYLTKLEVTQSYFFLKTQPSQDHRMLLEMLVQEAMSHDNREKRAERTEELIDLPLTEEEEQWFEEFLLEGKGRSLHASRDTVMARRLATGRYPDAVDVGQQLSGRRFNDVTWDGVKDILSAGLGSRATEGIFKMADFE
ncbi:nuclear pore complex assembly-domain-containing protein [Macrophomina phaseolina]|uniref:Nuclear pore complex assembly-domain-containing protein n=1 Tax=Macrophomina phaseolina TaxID=35725 RepID=A0ABQ8GA59_9PEZI|nr:nuclear pore complex assembly-domain-containing protein [Macrophomina phaseolina]